MINLDYKFEDKLDSIRPDDLEFLDLTGRRAYWSQGFYGQGETVAVVDTGVSPHPEFEDRLLKGRNFSRDYNRDPNKYHDDRGHGTHVAGSIAGKNVGVAPKAEILPVRVLSADGSGEWSDVSEALEWINEWRHPVHGRKVSAVSMSLSADDRGIRASEIQRLKEAVKALVENDIAVFCSMGNTGGDSIRYPASLDEVIAVGAVDVEKEKAYFTTTGNHADICQIGVQVLSAWYKGGYVYMSGTSMSTPISSGLSTLLSNKYRETFNKRISEPLLYEMVKMNTKDLGIKGVDKVHGAGFFTLQPLEFKLWTMHGEKNIVINGETITMETEAEIDNGRFVVPLRYLTDPAGAYVMWNPENKSAIVRY